MGDDGTKRERMKERDRERKREAHNNKERKALSQEGRRGKKVLAFLFSLWNSDQDKETQKAHITRWKILFFWKTSDEDGIFWGLAEGQFGEHSLVRERESFVRWVWLEDIWTHLTSLSFCFSHSFFLSFLFFFLLHKFWSSWAIDERERGGGLGSVDSLGFDGKDAWSFHVSSFIVFAICCWCLYRERERERVNGSEG